MMGRLRREPVQAHTIPESCPLTEFACTDHDTTEKPIAGSNTAVLDPFHKRLLFSRLVETFYYCETTVAETVDVFGCYYKKKNSSCFRRATGME